MKEECRDGGIKALKEGRKGEDMQIWRKEGRKKRRNVELGDGRNRGRNVEMEEGRNK
jgi:hypothetical protein